MHVAVPQWVKAWWTTTADVCDVKVTVKGDDVDILYPSNTATYTSFSKSAALAEGTLDYTAFRVTAHGRAGLRKLDLSVSYVKMAEGSLKPWATNENVKCTGVDRTLTTRVRLPVGK